MIEMSDGARRSGSAALEFAKSGALVAVSHSGGKDSQAMLIKLRQWEVPLENVVLFHANLGRVAWPHTVAHIERYARGLEIVLCPAKTDLLTRVRQRGMWPSPSMRWCTSDLKTGPIEREIRRHLKKNPRFGGRVISCMGIRAAESAQRRKKTAFRRSERNSRAGRDWWEWLPIFEMSTAEVFETIKQSQEQPHYAYALGMSRLSCRFCIMASEADLRISAWHNPDLLHEYAQTERDTGHTLRMDRTPISAFGA